MRTRLGMNGNSLNVASLDRARVYLFCICLTLSLLAHAAPAWPESAKFSNVVITNNRDDLLLFLEAQHTFNEKIQSAILSGVPVSFSFYITLVRVRFLWMDRTIRDKEVVHTILYDNLKKEFQITRSWEKGESITTQSFEEAEKLMSEIKSFKIAPLKRLHKGTRYQLRVRAKLNRITLPYYLDSILFFLPKWDYETDWYTIDFIY